MEEKRSPGDFLRLILGKGVKVKLVTGHEYAGILAALDESMNIVLEKVEEFEKGVLSKKYEEMFIRGNNGRIGSLLSSLY